MKKLFAGGFLMLPFLLMACPDTSNICDPACEKDSCMICDASGDTPVCVSACGEGLTCNSGLCQAPATSDTCDPVCGACQTCDLSGTAPTCVDLCGDNTTCQNGECVAPAVAECSPACGSCQMCDTSGASPVCVDQCGDDTVCDNGACVPLGCDTPCVDCHVGSMHKIPGTGTNTPISEGPLACTDCHGMNPHSTENLNNHAQDIACQTCHIPTYSRQLPTKINWDWTALGYSCDPMLAADPASCGSRHP